MAVVLLVRLPGSHDGNMEKGHSPLRWEVPTIFLSLIKCLLRRWHGNREWHLDDAYGSLAHLCGAFLCPDGLDGQGKGGAVQRGDLLCSGVLLQDGHEIFWDGYIALGQQDLQGGVHQIEVQGVVRQALSVGRSSGFMPESEKGASPQPSLKMPSIW